MSSVLFPNGLVMLTNSSGAAFPLFEFTSLLVKIERILTQMEDRNILRFRIANIEHQ